MGKHKSTIDWKSKLLDLLIVIIGITIAFKLNTWNESIKENSELKNYLQSFKEENDENIDNLASIIEICKNKKQDIDSGRVVLTSDTKLANADIYGLSKNLMTFAQFYPNNTTMENIKASGQFELLQKVDIRNQIISTYAAFDNAVAMEKLLLDYSTDFVTPFFFDNFNFFEKNKSNTEALRNFKFINLYMGYIMLLDQQIRGYETSLRQAQELDQKLKEMGLEED
ncbi:hypothetical protein [Fulvivirga ligni]|uniref:hypothetical protein n=1 Tax=Fulvivirga ligni TaxID=2904246 RepID=UPI001F2828A0|nr:hypothetical protein [Fulvivirga ligni]UII20903.1 hypothetical protein LVD16_23965 [Fulvivirga ligni]